MNQIAITSNFDDENYNEQLVNIPPLAKHRATVLCELLNQWCSGDRHPDYYRVVPVGYRLKKAADNY